MPTVVNIRFFYQNLSKKKINLLPKIIAYYAMPPEAENVLVKVKNPFGFELQIDSMLMDSITTAIETNYEIATTTIESNGGEFTQGKYFENLIDAYIKKIEDDNPNLIPELGEVEPEIIQGKYETQIVAPPIEREALALNNTNNPVFYVPPSMHIPFYLNGVAFIKLEASISTRPKQPYLISV